MNKSELKTVATIFTAFFVVLVIVAWFSNFLFGSLLGLGFVKPLVSFVIIFLTIWWIYSNRKKVWSAIKTRWNKIMGKVEEKEE